ncbi:MAG: malto-oligosyltrehalose synthase [Actinobacteria bacterium 13_2_20CM_2_71_6]|nr:MAG: malto-oligosyltrehalose synthase [Actinobacteria bacterium 13_2_20CM_2_71_6]
MPPRATYRIQVRPDFDLAATAALAGYLAELGVTHLYSAPLLAAVPGSAHGYDVCDPTRLNPELGGDDGLRVLVEALRDKGLGLVVDIVPNHSGVAVPEANPAWWSVLREGPASPYAGWFDIDWSRGRLMIPVLGDDDGPADLSIVDDELRYYEHRYPIAPGTGDGTPEEVHERQHYELVSWRRANAELNYRRFFAIADLAGLRVERPEVLHATHAEPLRWVAEGLVDGLRIDHPDGLRDPAGYLSRLREAAPGAWLVIEKILEVGEELPDWPVDGTTGYDALREVCGLFVDPGARRAYPSRVSWGEAARTGKTEAATRLLATELDRLARLIPDLPEAAEALAELAADFPVYRSYLPDGEQHLSEALARARKRRPELPFEALEPRLRDPADELAIRFQQFTGAVMAKGVEDTAFYRFTRFIALNEVGGAPDHFGVPPEEFHAAAAHRLARWPVGMTTLATHDTKRSEDVRARLAVLSELPDEWRTAVDRWAAAAPVPGPDFAALLWQTVAGAWPIERERLVAYAIKAAREASTHTSWDSPNNEFEESVLRSIDILYSNSSLRADVDEFVSRITPYGWSNSLGQKLIQIMLPGVPDTYQGTELWDNSLVDPDNRRPVDFAARRELLVRLDAGWRPPVDASGAAKLLVTSRALRVRRERELSGYAPIRAHGAAAEHAVAVDRGGVIAVATRLPVRLYRSGGWGEATLPLPDGVWIDTLSGTSFSGPEAPLGLILDTYPVGLLVAA